MTKIGYSRVSTDDQHPEAQELRLREAGCELIFTDKGVSGTLASRPEWDRCLAYLRRGDQLVIVKLDRAGRSLKHLIEVVERLDQGGIDLVVLDQGIDTSTPAGKLLFHVIGAIAEFERSLIVERTKAGLAATSKRGRSGGRRPALAEYQVAHARKQVDAGVAVADVAKELGVDRATVYRALSRASNAPTAR